MAQDSKKAIRELEKEVEKLRSLLRTDELTGILNRRGLMEEFDNLFDEVLHLKKGGSKRRRIEIDDVSVVFIDLDNFKNINDTYGHEQGDLVLQASANLLARSIRGIDKVGRYGGEEFVVVLTGSTEDEGYNKAEELRKSLGSLSVGGKKHIDVRASMGVSSLSKSNAKTCEELINLADKAMYEAKTNRGKNNTVKYSELV